MFRANYLSTDFTQAAKPYDYTVETFPIVYTMVVIRQCKCAVKYYDIFTVSYSDGAEGP